MGFRVGFLKPFRDGSLCSFKAAGSITTLTSQRISETERAPGSHLPFSCFRRGVETKGRDEIMAEFKSLAQELSESKDILIIMGSKHIFFDDAACPIPDIAFIPELEADCVLVHRYRKVSRTVYSVLSVSSLVKDKMKRHRPQPHTA
jgi:hypothetical protein